MNKKLVTTLAATALVAAIGVGSTLAFLSDQTGTVTNTFTVGKVDISLDETGLDGEKTTTGVNYTDLVATQEVTKDPTVYVATDSEDAYVFVKLEVVKDSEDQADMLDYEIATGWTALSGVNNVYYRVVNKADTTRTFAVLKDNKVTVKDELVGTDKIETLKFTAYAVQKLGLNSAEEAYAVVNR